MNATMRCRTGLALPMVLGAITLIGTMVAGVMYLATQDYRVGANTLNESRAEASAEMGLNHLLYDWDRTKKRRRAAGDTLGRTTTDPEVAWWKEWVTRLPGPFSWA